MAVYSRQACSRLPTLLRSCFVLLSGLCQIRALIAFRKSRGKGLLLCGRNKASEMPVVAYKVLNDSY